MDFDSLLAKDASIVNEVFDIKLTKISRDITQPRKFFDQQKLNELADDINQHGLLQPILVRKAEDSNDDEHFVIVAGERRFAAVEMLGKETIPAIVLSEEILSSCDNIGYLQMSENMKRDDLKFYEMSEFIISRSNAGESQADIAKKLGMHRQVVCYYFCWADAPDWLKDFKEHFRSIRSFYSFYQEAKTHPNELKAFFEEHADQEFFSNGDCLKFKAQLVKSQKEQNQKPTSESGKAAAVESLFSFVSGDAEDSAKLADSDSISGDTLESPTPATPLKQNAGSISYPDALDASDAEVKLPCTKTLGQDIVQSDDKSDTSSGDDLHGRQIERTNKVDICLPKTTQPIEGLANIKLNLDLVTQINGQFDSTKNLKIENSQASPENAGNADGLLEYPPYSAEDFLHEVFMSKKDYDALVQLIDEKQNVILQGAPGVGKTFAAQRLAYSILGNKDPERVKVVQFHQNYSYDDFIQGFRPTGNGGFALQNGIFYNFCKKAEQDPDHQYFLVIDEINRGNLSKIFGELFMLLESDKRGVPLQLLYSPKESFTVPKNLYIIGLMNTADRSLAMLDIALRRRFAFFTLKPAFESAEPNSFSEYVASKNCAALGKLLAEVKLLNQIIASEPSLGRGFVIGHSFFCKEGEVTKEWLQRVINYELVPLLSEYWFDEPSKISDWERRLNEAVK